MSEKTLIIKDKRLQNDKIRRIISRAGLLCDYHVQDWTEETEKGFRSFVRISEEELRSRIVVKEPDFVMLLGEVKLKKCKDVKDGGTVIVNSENKVDYKYFKNHDIKGYNINAKELGDPWAVMAGSFAKLSDLTLKSVKNALDIETKGASKKDAAEGFGGIK